MKPSTTSCIAALLACLAASGCGGSQPAPAAPAQPATAAPEEESTKDTMVSAPAAGAAPAAAPQAEAPSSTRARERKPQSDIEIWDHQLDGVLTLSTPDCNTAWTLRDRICDLAQRLCDLASRSAEPEVADRCTDGRARCDRATTRVRSACPE